MGDFEDCCEDYGYDIDEENLLEGNDDYYDDSLDDDENSIFEDPNGNSALRKVTRTNPRNQPCPTCGEPNMLTPADVRLSYQCDQCSDKLERGF